MEYYFRYGSSKYFCSSSTPSKTCRSRCPRIAGNSNTVAECQSASKFGHAATTIFRSADPLIC